eukprot:Pgem_evm1s3695
MVQYTNEFAEERKKERKVLAILPSNRITGWFFKSIGLCFVLSYLCLFVPVFKTVEAVDRYLNGRNEKNRRTWEMCKLAMEVLVIHDIDYVVAPAEADTMLVYLAKKNNGFIITDDYDHLMSNVPVLLRFRTCNVKSGRRLDCVAFTPIDRQFYFEKSGHSEQSFLLFCLIRGQDYTHFLQVGETRSRKFASVALTSKKEIVNVLIRCWEEVLQTIPDDSILFYIEVLTRFYRNECVLEHLKVGIERMNTKLPQLNMKTRPVPKEYLGIPFLPMAIEKWPKKLFLKKPDRYLDLFNTK